MAKPKKRSPLLSILIGAIVLLCICGAIGAAINPSSSTPTPAPAQLAAADATAPPVVATDALVPTDAPVTSPTVDTPTATPEQSPVETPTQLPTSEPVQPSPTQQALESSLPSGEDALVIKIVDGDTIDVLIAGQPFTVRYIGIDTPESKDPNTPVQCWANEASQANGGLVAGQIVRLERDQSDVDRYGRLLRYVWLEDGRLVNEELVRSGHAFAKRYQPDTSRATQLEAAMQQAQSSNVGLWAACTIVDLQTQPIGADPASVIVATEAPAANTGGGGGAFPAIGEACPPEAPIKGNINSKGEKIYHSPGQQAYERTIPEACYATGADAEQDGFRAAQR